MRVSPRSRSPAVVATALAAILLFSGVGTSEHKPADGSPDVVSVIATADVEEFVNAMFVVPEVAKAFEDGDTLSIDVRKGSSVTGTWNGPVRDRKVVLAPGTDGSATHAIHVDEAAMFSIVNAYDVPNTVKMAVKRQFLTAESQRATVNLAIGAVVRTPLDARLATQAPRAGDAITFQGCSEKLYTWTSEYLLTALCGRLYLVNELGGISGFVYGDSSNAAVALSTIATGGASLRVFDGAAFTLGADLIMGEDGSEEEADAEVEDETMQEAAKRKKAATAKRAEGKA